MMRLKARLQSLLVFKTRLSIHGLLRAPWASGDSGRVRMSVVASVIAPRAMNEMILRPSVSGSASTRLTAPSGADITYSSVRW